MCVIVHHVCTGKLCMFVIIQLLLFVNYMQQNLMHLYRDRSFYRQQKKTLHCFNWARHEYVSLSLHFPGWPVFPVTDEIPLCLLGEKGVTKLRPSKEYMQYPILNTFHALCHSESWANHGECDDNIIIPTIHAFIYLVHKAIFYIRIALIQNCKIALIRLYLLFAIDSIISRSFNNPVVSSCLLQRVLCRLPFLKLLLTCLIQAPLN